MSTISRVLSFGVAHLLAAAVAPCQFFVGPGQATAVESAFRSALSGSVAVEDFDSYPHSAAIRDFQCGACQVHVKLLDAGGTYRKDNGNSFQSSFFSTPNVFYNRALMNGWYGSFYPRIELSFCPPVEGFGVWVFDDGPDDRFVMTAVEANGSSSSSTTLYRPNTNIQLEGFLGYVSPNGIERVWIEQQSPTGGPPNNLAFQLDYAQVGPPLFTAASFQYGAGSGASGAPQLSLGAPPTLGTVVPLQLSNPAGASGIAALAIGTAPAFHPGALSGVTLLVDQPAYSLVVLPSGGLTMPLSLPNDPALRGLCFHLQGIEVDSGRWAVSQGLKIVPN